LHIGYLRKGNLKVNDSITLKPDFERRKPIASNHTTTHLLNFGLRKILGNKVIQQGSEVTEEKLRFDFKYQSKVSENDLIEIENIVKKIIVDSLNVYTKIENIENAKKLPNIVLLEGEVYPNPVRIISIGKNIEKIDDKDEISLEFCGGTHLSNTNEVECFSIISEVGVSKGTRRIIGVTKSICKKIMTNSLHFGKSINDTKKLKGIQFIEKVEKLQTEIKNIGLPLVDRNKYEKEINELFQQSKHIQKEFEKDTLDQCLSFIKEITTNFNSKQLVVDLSKFSPNKKIADNLLEKLLKFENIKNSALMIIYVNDDKISITSNVPNDLNQKLNASEWVNQTAMVSNGKGYNGNASKCQGQGLISSKIYDSIKKANDFAIEKLNE